MLATEPTLIFFIRDNRPLACSRNHILIPQVPCDYAFFLFKRSRLDYLIHPFRMHDALELETCSELLPLFVRIHRLRWCRLLASEKREDVDLWRFGSSFNNFSVLFQLALRKRLHVNWIRMVFCMYSYSEPFDHFVCDSLVSTKMNCLQSGCSSQTLTNHSDNLSRHSC